MNKKTKLQFKVIDLEYWEKYGINGLETVIDRKQEQMNENEQKDEAFWALVNEDGFTIPLTNDSVIKGSDLKRMGGYILLCKSFKKDGFDKYDEAIFKEVDVGFGVSERKTVYQAVDAILNGFGIATPKSKEAKKVFRNIFWVTRRSFKYETDLEEIKELRILKQLKEEEDNSFDPTKIEDYLPTDSLDEDFDLFGLK